MLNPAKSQNRPGYISYSRIFSENEKRLSQYFGMKILTEVLKWLYVLSVGRMNIHC